MRVLVADDESDIVELLRTFLEARGCEVRSAANGHEALDQVALERFDAIVLDVAMPGLDGLCTLRLLKARPDTADIPVVLLTAHAADEDIAAGYRAGADLYLRKPFVPVQLLAMLELLPDRQDAV